MTINAVLIDVGGVFHLPDPVHIRGALARVGLRFDTPTADRAHYAGVAALSDFSEGDRALWETYSRGYVRALGADGAVLEEAVPILLAEFTTGLVWTRVVPGSGAALGAIAAVGVRVAIVSNSDGTVEQRLREDGICQVGPGPGVEVAAILDSGVVGVSKPDPEIFRLALERLGGVAPERAIHVGDTPAADVEGARAAGVRPVLFDPFDDHPHLDVERVHDLSEVAALVAADGEAPARPRAEPGRGRVQAGPAGAGS